MNDINKIIREEINRYILSEAIDFNNLRSYSIQLNKSVGNLGNINASSFNNDLKKFFYDLTVYCLQIIEAINRCVQANSLNEASFGNLSSYGINLPPELGGNIVSDFKQGYYNTKRRFQGSGYGGRNSSGYAKGNRISSNSVPQVKLSALLYNLQSWQQAYSTKNAQYNIDSFTQEPYNILIRIIPNIQNEYNAQMRNAQGTNP